MRTSIYNPVLWDTIAPANVRGGKSRAIKAVRDKHGRFMPDDQLGRELWSLDKEHGKPGGLALLAKRGKEYFKELSKRRWNKCIS